MSAFIRDGKEGVGKRDGVEIEGWKANCHSASPLNGEAAELWDKDPATFQQKVTVRHRDIEDE